MKEELSFHRPVINHGTFNQLINRTQNQKHRYEYIRIIYQEYLVTYVV